MGVAVVMGLSRSLGGAMFLGVTIVIRLPMVLGVLTLKSMFPAALILRVMVVPIVDGMPLTKPLF